MPAPPEPPPEGPAISYVTCCYEHTEGVLGAEVRMNLAGVEGVLGWMDRLEALGEGAYEMRVALPAGVTVRWLTGEALDDEDPPLEETLPPPPPGTSHGLPFELTDEPLGGYEEAEGVEFSQLMVTSYSAYWTGPGEDDDHASTPSLSRKQLEAIRDDLRRRQHP